MKLPSEKPACPSRRTSAAVRTELRRRQAERGSKGCWDAEHPHRDWPSRFRTRIASQPLGPREARACALRTGEDRVRGGRRSGRRRQAHLDALRSHQLHTGTPVFSAAPISPEHRCGTHLERMQQHTHLARLGGHAAIPLTLLAQRTRATVANAGCIHQAQTAIGLATPLLDPKRLPCGTAECPVGLERKVGSGEAPRFSGGGGGRRAIPRCGSG